MADLERCVAERTAELEVALSNLHAQMSQRAQAEAKLRESEERYRRLVELSPDAVLVVTRRKLLYVNAAGVHLFGARSAEELLAKPPLNLVYESERPVQFETRMVRLDGSPIDVEISCARVNFDGEPADQLLIRDATERRAIERMKDELLSIVSHELRTPLTSLRGSLGLLAAGLVGEMPRRARRMLEIAITNSDRLIRLLNDVLDLERIRAGRVTLQLGPHPAAHLVEAAVDQMYVLAEQAGVRLSIGDVGGVVNADADRMTQVLTNLISNAIKFSPSGSVVQLASVSKADRVRFSVADRGRGIPSHHLEAIFERFGQVDASDSRLNGGAGLGLAICRGIVDQHDGRLWAESALGQGSTFYVELRSAAVETAGLCARQSLAAS
jgi:PAS domain S-box-containing protein